MVRLAVKKRKSGPEELKIEGIFLLTAVQVRERTRAGLCLQIRGTLLLGAVGELLISFECRGVHLRVFCDGFHTRISGAQPCSARGQFWESGKCFFSDLRGFHQCLVPFCGIMCRVISYVRFSRVQNTKISSKILQRPGFGSSKMDGRMVALVPGWAYSGGKPHWC